MKVETIIIGSGVAGAALVSRLLKKNPNASIVMLEAGSKIEMKNFAQYQNYVISGQTPYASCQDLNYPDRDKPGENTSTDKNLTLRGARLLMYGGSTVHWGGWSFRLKPEDFRLKSLWKIGIDWPINYDDLEPYYGQAEHYIGVAGNSDSAIVPRSTPYPYPAYPFTLEDQKFRSALEKFGYEYTNMPIARHGISDTESTHAPCKTTGTCKYCPFGARYVAANYLDDLIKYNDYPNFKIIKNAFVQTINMVSKGKTDGVVYKDQNTKEEITLHADKIIVAAGAIESAKLLLRSTSKFWENGIGNDNDLVGRNLITHPYFIYQAEIDSNPERLQPEMDFPTLVSRHFDSTAEQNEGKFILVSPPTAPFPANENGNANSLVKLMQMGYTREQIDKIVTGKTFVQIHGIMEVFSELENRIENLDKTNHLGLLETSVIFKQPVTFNERMKKVEKYIENIFTEMGAKNMKQIMMSWRADHAACLTRMSDAPETGVVDKDLKIFNVDNVYVLSNSSFSSLGAVNPTLTLTALSLRLSDHLINQ
jgi:choline dehydrogenase-like flavoprotein